MKDVRTALRPGKNRRLLCWLLAAIMSVGVGTRATKACTSFAMDYRGGLLFGSNFDNSFKPGLLYVNKRGVGKSGWPMDEHDTPATWTSKYGSVTIHTAPYQYAWAGMNEAGLVISTMQLDETQVPPPDERPSLISAAWVQYVLDTCTTVDDIIAAERQVRLSYGVDHYLACDATGQCLAVEFLEGKPVYHRGEDLPLKAMSFGGPYDRYFERRRGGSASGEARSITVGSLAHIDKMFRGFKPGTPKAAVDYAFRILKDVSAPNTTWSLVFDVPRRIVFIRTYKNKRPRRLAFDDLDFSCRTPAMMLDVHADLAGDLASHLQEYAHDATLRHALEAVAFHKPDIPEETVVQMVQHAERFPCAQAAQPHTP
jgi:choloylglycine hydrolase